MNSEHWHSCNVLRSGAEEWHLWSFHGVSKGPELTAEASLTPGATMTQPAVRKEWRNLWQRKYNIAWLPADRVYFRTLELPVCDASELRSMVEFQIERLSPLPMGQVVWGVEPLPFEEGAELRTAIVCIAERDSFEEFLGELEQAGYFVDKLEIPGLRQLIEVSEGQDGIWIIPNTDGIAEKTLIAWRIDGKMRNVQLITLSPPEPTTDRGDGGPDDAAEPSPPQESEATDTVAEGLVGHLSQMTWAGEMEGWLEGPAPCFLVSDDATAGRWRARLEDWSGTALEVREPIPAKELAVLTAHQLRPDDLATNLLPAEYADQYRQQFVDRLWMRGLAAVLVLYLISVAGYFGLVQWADHRQTTIDRDSKQLETKAKEADELEREIRLLQDQAALKFAALDCLLAISQELPPSLTIESVSFNRGRTLTVYGTGPVDGTEAVLDFHDAMSDFEVVVGGESSGGDDVLDYRALFAQVNPPSSSIRKDNRGQFLYWNLVCELYREDLEEIEEGGTP